MGASPAIVTHVEQPYAAVKARVDMDGVSDVAARFGDVFGWIARKNVSPAGPPFLRYDVIDMAGELEMEAGVPVVTPGDPDGEVVCGVLPAGRYATVTHVGHPKELLQVTRSLLDWGTQQGLSWDVTPGEDGEHWGCRLEIQLTDPRQEPDMSKWETQLAFRLAER
jgi:GyrI-like small molecule binding domain